MKAQDRDRIIARYNERLAAYGADIRTLASGTEERRRIRFEILRSIGVDQGCSVLDVGCGFGDLFGYLHEQALTVRYLGVDINPGLIEIARRRYPGAEFRVADVQTESLGSFDFVVSTSAFNLKLEATDNYEFIADMLERAFAMARRGVAIDFLSSYADFQSPEAFHYSPERIFAIAKGLTKRVQLRHDYPLYEFCVYLYPDFEGWRR